MGFFFINFINLQSFRRFSRYLFWKLDGLLGRVEKQIVHNRWNDLVILLMLINFRFPSKYNIWFTLVFKHFVKIIDIEWWHGCSLVMKTLLVIMVSMVWHVFIVNVYYWFVRFDGVGGGCIKSLPISTFYYGWMIRWSLWSFRHYLRMPKTIYHFLIYIQILII